MCLFTAVLGVNIKIVWMTRSEDLQDQFRTHKIGSALAKTTGHEFYGAFGDLLSGRPCYLAEFLGQHPEPCPGSV